MKSLKYLFLTLPLSIGLFSCDYEEYFTPIVEVQLPPHSPKLVLYSQMWEGDDSIKVFVTRSRGPLDKDTFPTLKIGNKYTWGNRDTIIYQILETADTVENAQVELYRNNALVATLKKGTSISGYYVAKLPSKLTNDGATYRIKVTTPQYGSIEAEQKMPKAVAIDTITYKPKVTITTPDDPFNYFTQSEYTLEFKDPINEKNYYGFESYYWGKVGKDSAFQRLYMYTYDPIANNGLLADESFDGKKATWRIHSSDSPNTGLPQFKKVKIYLVSISEAYYNYQQTLNRYWNAKDNPFAEPVVLYTNVKGGFGLFTMGSYSSYDYTIK